MFNKKIFFIFLFAFLIRLIALNQSLWLDEAIVANVVKNLSFSEILTKFSPTDFHPPLYYLFMKLWTVFFGYSEIALRMPSIIFSLGTGYFIYLIGGLLPATLFLFNPLIVYYSQEARMYVMATLFLTTALFFFIRISNNKALDSRRSLSSTPVGGGNDIWFCFFISLAFLTFYGSIFLIAAMLIYLLFKKQYKTFIISCSMFLVSLAIVSPLLYQQLINSKASLSQVTNWSLVLGKANLKDLLLIPVKFSIGRISFYPKWLYWLIAGGWTGFVLFSIKTVLNKTVFIKTVFYLLIFPLVLGFAVSFFIPMLQYFRFLYLIPIVCLLLGFRASSQALHNRRGYALVGGFLMFSLTYLLLPKFHREDWKSLVAHLPKNQPIYMIKASSDPIKYYDNNLKINELGIASYELNQDKITIIPYAAEIYGIDYGIQLTRAGYRFKNKVSFRELTYEQWVKN